MVVVVVMVVMVVVVVMVLVVVVVVVVVVVIINHMETLLDMSHDLLSGAYVNCVSISSFQHICCYHHYEFYNKSE